MHTCYNGGWNLRETELVEKIRNDTSFDLAIISTAAVEKMTAELFLFDGEVPVFSSYYGHAIKKVLERLPYNPGREYPSSIRITW
ncbi:MAG TPA: hypothetical protein VJJ21_05225 [Candidatus Nanoarchaeia archaeon]|nr:hypothetical protein [Candidatus Nanoarchaeia archaeon]